MDREDVDLGQRGDPRQRVVEISTRGVSKNASFSRGDRSGGSTVACPLKEGPRTGEAWEREYH